MRPEGYWTKPLTDTESLEEAERIYVELEDLPLDNSENTDVEDDDDYNESLPATSSGGFILGEDADFGANWENIELVEELSYDGTTEATVTGKREENEEQNCVTQNTATKSKAEPDRKWRKREKDTEVPTYGLPEGLIGDLFVACQTPTDYFILLLGSAVKDITFQTNLYATHRNKNLKLKEEDLLCFIGINFFMSYHTVPSYKHYWSTSSDLRIPLVSQAMTRNRFQEILSNLHVNENSAIPKYNKHKLYKVRPLLETLNRQFSRFYNGTRALAVDESMIIFKGRSRLKQYNPMKPIKRGYKLWCLADQKGYIKNLDVYQGKNAELEKYLDFGLGDEVVLKLTENEWGKHRIIYFDNFFTSVPLLEKLMLEKTLACGTIRANKKGCPKNMVADDKKMKRGEHDSRISNSDISYFKWKDNKCVNFSSNYHGTETAIVRRKQKDGSKIEVTCPRIVVDYNKNMGAVDHADQLRGSYAISRRSKKWWHRLFFGFIDIAFVNTFILYSLSQEEPVTLLNFRRSIAMGLINKSDKLKGKKRATTASQAAKRRRYNYSVSNDVRLGNRGSHWVTFVKERERCENCSSKCIQSRPNSKCTACGVFLCCNNSKNCFSEYHDI